MSDKRRIDIFSAGCPACQAVIDLVNELACPSCEVSVRDMHDPGTARMAEDLGIGSLPAVVIGGVLAGCCAGGPDETALRAAGLGRQHGASSRRIS